MKAGHSTTDAGSVATREQLLATATEVFAECGFRNATIRDICQRAEANVAAVNYHFGGKEELYAEVLRRNFRGALQRFPAHGGVGPDAPPTQRLRGFIRSFVQRIFVTGPDSCHGRMLAREMIDPTPALDTLVATEIRSLAANLESIVRALLGPKAADWQVRVCLASVVSQIVFYQHCRPVISRLFPDLQFDSGDLDALVDHITTFSLAGIRAAARRAP
ncbi:MAG: CerR family C-terminal domain-containing protein [Verrucomicrobiales bacterium]|nr:CerR family C-terminal domain-containing protein [Verrucomicrobiales bacterium]